MVESPLLLDYRRAGKVSSRVPGEDQEITAKVAEKSVEYAEKIYSPLSTLLATFTPLKPLTYLEMPR
jgi:hypothetical protein